MTTYIAIRRDGGDCDTYLTDTDEQIAEAREALIDAGLDSAPIYVGEPDGLGDSYRNGQVLHARPR